MAIPVTFIGDKYAKASNSNPRVIQPGQFQTYQPFNTSTSVRINNFVWLNSPIEAGKTFLTSQGRRFVLDANQSRVIYILINSASSDNNKPFIQQTKGFIGDVTSYPYEKAGRNLQTVKKLAEYEVQILIGIFSVTSWAAFATVMAIDVLAFTANNKDKFPKWERIVKACLKARKELKQYAPVLYEKLVYSTLLIAWEGTKYAGDKKGEIAESVAESALKDPKVAGRGAGIIVGKIGMNAMQGKVSVLSAVWTILFTVATKAATAIPGAVQTSLNGIKNTDLSDKMVIADEMLKIIQNSNVSLSKAEAVTIVEEVLAHPKELVNTLKELANAFKDDAK